MIRAKTPRGGATGPEPGSVLQQFCLRWIVDARAGGAKTGHVRAVNEGRHEKRSYSLHRVPPLLTCCGCVGCSHVLVCQGIPRIPKDIIMQGQATDGVGYVELTGYVQRINL